MCFFGKEKDPVTGDCIACPENTWNLRGESCTPCPDGQITLKKGAMVKEECHVRKLIFISI